MTGTTKAIPSRNPHNDLRVIWSGDNKRIVSDQRPQGLDKPVRRAKVIGPRKKQ